MIKDTNCFSINSPESMRPKVFSPNRVVVVANILWKG